MILKQWDMVVLRVVIKLRLQAQNRMHLIAALLGIYIFPFSAIAITCDEWFEKLNLKTSSVSCVADCTRAADKAAEANKEFYCTPYCRGMCVLDNDEAKCKFDPFWTAKLNSETKPFSRLHGEGLRAVEVALSQIPKTFRPKNLKAIVKASGPGDITSLSSPATSSDEIFNSVSKGLFEPRAVASSHSP